LNAHDITERPASVASWDEKYTAGIRSAWTQNPTVEREIYMRMTGQPGHWLDWAFRDKLPRLKRVLSIGCGDGSHELAIARQGYASEIKAFDASPVAIEQARAAAAAEGLKIDFSVDTFESFAASNPEGALMDAVLFSGSLHHVTDIEGLLFAVRRHLKPGGFVIVNEYVGPCYQLYGQQQIDVVNAFLDRAPVRFKIAPDAKLSLPTIEMIMAADPTEGVRANLIQPLLPMFFKPIYWSPFAGGLLHPIFGFLDDRSINDGSAESQALVEMLIVADTELTRLGALENEFLFAILTNPG
jgi:SAM-dependent methyltransferase